jgi:single-stranded-DNA-specific exonuclease
VGENRELVRLGLQRINSGARPGIRSLMETAGLKRGDVNAEAIGYGLGPRINAAGRLGAERSAYDLLMASTTGEADLLSRELETLNRRRQRMTREFTERAQAEAAQTDAGGDPLPLVFVSGEDYHEGILGLIAGRLADDAYRPAIAVKRGTAFCRGSARSIDEFDITRALDECADLLEEHGGHAGAAGFTVRTDQLDALRARLLDIATRDLGGKELAPQLVIDARIDVTHVSDQLIRELEMLEPFGEANPKPLFLSEDVPVIEARAVGRGGNHLKLALDAGGMALDAIAFRQGDWAQADLERVDIVYSAEFNDWRGVRSVQLNVQDLCPAGARPAPRVLWTEPNGPSGEHE